MINNKFSFLRCVIAFFLIIVPKFAYCAAYSTSTYSTSGLATSYAGSVTGIHDASDMFFNPAILSDVQNNQVIASVSHLNIDTDVDSASGNYYSGGADIVGKEVSDAGSDATIPALYLSASVSDNTVLGFAITSPFGLATKYDEGWIGRYQSIETSLQSYNFNPAVAHKINNNLSIGFGFQAQYYKAAMTRMVRYGGGDYFGKLHGSGWGYGYNLGADYKVNDNLELGLGYRSKIDHNLNGTSRVDDLGLHSDVNAKTTTPESLTLGAAYKVDDKLKLAYDVTWTRWSRVQNIVVNAYQNSALNETTNFNFHDSFLHSIGGDFRVNSNLLLRSGLAYEKNAVTDANRGAKVPDANKIWASIGFNYNLKNGLSVDATYMHQFFETGNVNIDATADNGASLNSKYKTRLDLFSFAVKKEF